MSEQLYPPDLQAILNELDRTDRRHFWQAQQVLKAMEQERLTTNARRS
jgi:hypothetical protein